MAITRAFDTAKNLWYQDIPGKGRVYDSPAAYGATPPQGGGAIHKNTSWDQNSGEWDTGLDWGKIYAWAIGAGLGVNAALAIANAAGAAGAAGTGAATGGGVGIGETGATGVGGLSATSLGLPATPGLGTAGGGAIAAGAGAVGSGAAPAAGTAAGGAGAAAAKALTGGQKIESLLAGLGGLLGGKALSHYLDPQGGVSPELSQLLQLSLDRAKSQQPLFNQINSGVSQMLPNFASKAGLLGGGT